MATRLASSSSCRCCVTAWRVMSMCSQSAVNVWPFSRRSRSSSRLRVGSASALKTLSMSNSRVATGGSLIPVVDLDVVRVGGTLAGLQKRLQAHQKDPPLGAAVVHELHRLLPILVREEDHDVVAFLLELPADLRADPFRGSIDDLPEH